ncbi:hypothetical protein TIFTF001_054992 [Ficus carica]|uniref:Uncharacterized protein n=1 Tax=Ficus carica TaxID=3494 RepID=A0AA88EGB9_FICCA|nr:hypothetical protein TIFTF001_054992 [Ficus carica]
MNEKEPLTSNCKRWNPVQTRLQCPGISHHSPASDLERNQLLLAAAAPGLPPTYQGPEFRTRSLSPTDWNLIVKKPLDRLLSPFEDSWNETRPKSSRDAAVRSIEQVHEIRRHPVLCPKPRLGGNNAIFSNRGLVLSSILFASEVAKSPGSESEPTAATSILGEGEIFLTFQSAEADEDDRHLP